MFSQSLEHNRCYQDTSPSISFLRFLRCYSYYVFVSLKDDDKLQREVKKGFHTACRLAGIEGLIWKDLRATFGTRFSRGRMRCVHDRQLLGHSDVRLTMRYVRSVEETKRVAVEAIKLIKKTTRFRFHPLELGEAALAEFFGYQLEGDVNQNYLDPKDIRLMCFKRSRRWKLC